MFLGAAGLRPRLSISQSEKSLGCTGQYTDAKVSAWQEELALCFLPLGIVEMMVDRQVQRCDMRGGPWCQWAWNSVKQPYLLLGRELIVLMF